MVKRRTVGAYPDFFPEEHIPPGGPGRKPITAHKVLEAALWILNTSAQWNILPLCYPNSKTVHRRFQNCYSKDVLREALTYLANTPRYEGALDESGCFIDASFALAKGGGNDIGPARRGKGGKNMVFVDNPGLPLATSTHVAIHYDVKLVQLGFDFYVIEAKPGNLISDREYGIDKLGDELRQEDINMIPQHRKNLKKPRTLDERRLCRYERRWLVEWFFAWIRWQPG